MCLFCCHARIDYGTWCASHVRYFRFTLVYFSWVFWGSTARESLLQHTSTSHYQNSLRRWLHGEPAHGHCLHHGGDVCIVNLCHITFLPGWWWWWWWWTMTIHTWWNMTQYQWFTLIHLTALYVAPDPFLGWRAVIGLLCRDRSWLCALCFCQGDFQSHWFIRGPDVCSVHLLSASIVSNTVYTCMYYIRH